MGYINKREEDKKIWNDDKEDKKMMSERKKMEESINGINKIKKKMKDSVEIIEMGEEEGEKQIVEDEEKKISEIKDEIERRKIEMII